MRKIARTQLKLYTRRQLAAQGGVCKLCHQPIDLSVPKSAVMDHDHTTGECRGVLCRACNGAEGKVANAAGRWGARSMDYAKILPWLKNLIAYLEAPGLGLVYPTHKTEEEKRLERNLKSRKQRAAKKAKVSIRIKPRDSNVDD